VPSEEEGVAQHERQDHPGGHVGGRATSTTTASRRSMTARLRGRRLDAGKRGRTTDTATPQRPTSTPTAPARRCSTTSRRGTATPTPTRIPRRSRSRPSGSCVAAARSGCGWCCDGVGATKYLAAAARSALGQGPPEVAPVWERRELLGPRRPSRVASQVFARGRI
jgi:hypothetical protein